MLNGSLAGIGRKLGIHLPTGKKHRVPLALRAIHAAAEGMVMPILGVAA